MLSDDTYVNSNSLIGSATVGVAIRTPRERLALAVSTCGVGYIPIVPATWGSAVTTGFYWLLLMGLMKLYAAGVSLGLRMPAIETVRLTVLFGLILTFGLVGIWASSKAEQLFRRKDPKPVVIDEVVGQLITFLFIPIAASPWVLLLGFFLFRAFDIVKPYPIRRLESLESGLGIMADDVLAGAYAAVVMALGYMWL